MMDAVLVRKWIQDLPKGSILAVDDGGLALVVLDENGTATDEYLEVGGIPQDDDEETL